MQRYRCYSDFFFDLDLVVSNIGCDHNRIVFVCLFSCNGLSCSSDRERRKNVTCGLIASGSIIDLNVVVICAYIAGDSIIERSGFVAVESGTAARVRRRKIIAKNYLRSVVIVLSFFFVKSDLVCNIRTAQFEYRLRKHLLMSAVISRFCLCFERQSGFRDEEALLNYRIRH